MRMVWTLHWILGAFLLPDCGGQSGEHHGAELDPGDVIFPLSFNDSVMADGVTGFIVQGQEDVLEACSITLLTSTMTTPSGHEEADPVTQEDLSPVKGLIDGTSSTLESLTVAVKEEIGRGSYQSVITKTLLDVKLQNEVSNNIMVDIRDSLQAHHCADSLLTKFKEKFGKMEAMLQTIHRLASQVEQTSESVALELSQDLGKSRQLESALVRKLY
ncbi:uncharacterized protein LOC127568703 [Pristis pectinata]|uniref:uncharacterized protein LOC127568703 n=1 Tax=Pristis pectinata TaxID=685728 RepID=UPI00223CEEB2|nr:uncharacterized protein LOC127568703 [Pristis pectinata]